MYLFGYYSNYDVYAKYNYDKFSANVPKNVGGTTSHQGLALFFIAISEMPMLFLSKKFIIKYKYRVILLFSAIFYIIRLTLLSLATSPIMIIGIGMLQALSFAVFLPTIIKLLLIV
ncbi:MFS transporter [Orenia metallireducens]|uniref:MFS transporter n=1 Tax=Orenia metallireducens TaxID=1413210 RepID=UPI001147A383